MAYFRVGEITRNLYEDLARAKEPFARAVSLLEQAVADFPDIPEYRHHLGRSYNGLASCLREAGRSEEAEQEFRYALDQFEQLERLPLSPAEDRSRRQELAWTYLNLGASLAKSKRSEQAEQAFRKVIALCEQLDAEFPIESFYVAWIGNAYLHLTQLLADNGEPEKADEIYRKLCELSPTSALSQASLAWLLADWKGRRNPGRAVQLARKAVESEPTNGRFSHTLGVALYRLGEWKDAVDVLKKSDEQLKGDLFSFNAFFLAMAHWQLGEQDQARTWYDKAVAWMDKNQPNSRQLLRFRAEAEELMKRETGQETDKKMNPDS
jgi:tetratricopeptide (TPR) repeat protein